MIVVIADDLTGAAELAGIGLRYGLDVEMSTVIDGNTKSELLVLDTDTRSMKEADAIDVVEKVTDSVMELRPELIFKKIDSVLRGHVIAELSAQLKILNLEKALIVAPNPSLGRTIQDGKYFYNDQPIHLSSFSNDPEFPIKSSDVVEMLRDKNVQVKKPSDAIPNGITVGEVINEDDLKAWAKQVDENILPAGGAGFFSAILETITPGKHTKDKADQSREGTTLFVCGTTFNKSRDAIKRIKQDGGPVSYMPEKIVQFNGIDEENFQDWSNEIIAFVHARGKAIIAIDAGTVIPKVSAAILREKTAVVVKEIFDKTDIHELFIEGGSTAAAVIRELGFHTFIPVEELAAGVVRMQVKDRGEIFITVKPGSYAWPEDVWNFD